MLRLHEWQNRVSPSGIIPSQLSWQGFGMENSTDSLRSSTLLSLQKMILAGYAMRNERGAWFKIRQSAAVCICGNQEGLNVRIYCLFDRL